MTRIYTPRAYHDPVMEFMLSRQRCSLFGGMGIGKTVLTYTALDAMYICGLESRPTLILGPKRVARDTWPDEVKKWEHLREISVSSITGDIDQRKRALKRDCSVYTTNYENLPWLIDLLGDKWPFGTVVADESTRLKSYRLNQGGKRSSALAQVAWRHVNRWINLTGTPAPNGLQDLWGQMWFIDQGKRLGRTYTAFSDRWFKTGYEGRGLKPLTFAKDQIHAAIKDVCLTIDPRDYFDLKEPIVNVIKIKLPPKARNLYDEFEAEMFAELGDGSDLEVFNAAALTMKCLQLANGYIYHKEGGKPIHDAKIEALESVINESGGMPVLVAYNFVSDMERICKAFPKAVLLSQKAGMEAFKRGDAPIGLAHPKSMGHGIDGLQDITNILVRFGHDWNLEERLQMLERIGPTRQMQSGHERPVFVHDIVAEDTIDETVLARHVSKASVQDLLLNAMKHRCMT